MAKKPESNGSNGDTTRNRSEFPKHTLEAALRIAVAIEERNGGNPLPPTDVAIAIGISPGSSELRVITSSCLKYNLTDGSYKSARIGLTDLGRRIVAPTSPEDKHRAELQAAMSPTTFHAMHDFFKGKKLPDPIFFQNTVVREFGVPRDHASKCCEIFVANMERVGLVRVAPTGKWLSTEAVPNAANITDGEPKGPPEEQDDPVEIPDPDLDTSSISPAVVAPAKTASAIFVGHGKNKRPLEQLKQILDHYRIPYRVATDEANHFRPISDKVADTMRECGAAILIFTADEEFKAPVDPQGESVWRPSENVVHELGAASILYGGRIIIFKEEAIKLPTNFSGIGYITFAKDDLASRAHDLFRELVSFGLIKISVGV